MKKLLSIVLVMAMLLSMSLAIPVSADTTPETVSKWDGTLPETHQAFNTWGGDGTVGNPYIIESAASLANLAKAIQNGSATWGMYFSLTCDIDMNGHKWVGIGDATGAAHRFEGIFLGNNHVIYNLKLESNENSGFFNLTHCASIYDLGIASGNIEVTYSTSAFNVGGLIGRAMGLTTISNCFSNADITVSNDGSTYVAKVGLLIGNINTSTSHSGKDFNITNCWVNGNINVNCTNKLVNVGGLIGAKGTNPLFVENCTVMCNIYHSAGVSGDKFAAFVSDNLANCTFTNSKASIYIETGVSPTQIPGAVGAVWSGTIAANDSSRNITLNVSGTKTVNPEPTVADNCTATTDEIKLTTTTMLSNNFAQNGIDENAGNIRFVSELGFSAGAFSETGYVVEFATKSAEIGGKVVYTSLKAADAEAEGGYKTLTPTGKYYIAYGISGIPEDVSGTVTVTPYVVLLDGTTTVYGASAEYTITDGVLQQNS